MSDKQRIAALEREVARLGEAVELLVLAACRDKYGHEWVPDYGPWRSLILRARRRTRARAADTTEAG